MGVVDRDRKAFGAAAALLVVCLPLGAGAKENVLTYQLLGQYSRGFQMALDGSTARPCRATRFGEHRDLEYDAHGRVVRFGTNAALRTRYDRAGRLLEELHVRIQGSADILYSTYHYRYDARGRLIASALENVDGRRATGRMEYDARGRLHHYVYGPALDDGVMAYDAAGRLVGIRATYLDGPVEVTYRYDAQGRLEHETVAFPALHATDEYAFAHDVRGRVTRAGEWTLEYCD